MKYIILAGIVFLVYRFVNPPNQIKEAEEESTDYVDYEEID